MGKGEKRVRWEEGGQIRKNLWTCWVDLKRRKRKEAGSSTIPAGETRSQPVPDRSPLGSAYVVIGKSKWCRGVSHRAISRNEEKKEQKWGKVKKVRRRAQHPWGGEERNTPPVYPKAHSCTKEAKNG